MGVDSTPLTASGSEVDESKYLKWQRWVFFVTFMNYAMSHFSRKCYTNVKVNLQANGVDTYILSQMDTAFMLTYALGSFISGRLGDTYSPSAVIGVGLLGSTLCLSLICMFVQTDVVHADYFTALLLFASAQLIHGLFQSTGGPVNTVIMGNWYPKKDRGLIFGLWTCHQYIGDIVAAVATAAMLHNGWHWLWALMVPGIANGVWALVNFFMLHDDPEKAGIVTAEAEAKKAQDIAEGKDGDAEKKPISFMEAVRLPNVIGYACAFGFFKFTNYAMFFWLPYFLSLHFDPQNANLISSLYSVGMMPGGVIVGWVSDKWGRRRTEGRRACVIAIFMCLLAPLLLMFAWFADTMPPPLLLGMLAVMGILVGGPNNIITSAVAADLANHPSLKGNNKALGTVTGIINGSGSITAAAGLMLIGPIQAVGGWTGVWYFLVCCVIMGTLLMSPKIISELSDEEEKESTDAGKGKYTNVNSQESTA